MPLPVLVLGAVALGVHGLATRTRFGRYVFAIGGNPRAAELAGIDVRGVTLRAFALLGALAGVAAVLTTARLGAGANSMGSQAELAVIAAAVLGGTSLAGGAGSVGGAVLGALWMQSLENGMVLLDVTSALRQVVIGLVLLAAVAADARARERTVMSGALLELVGGHGALRRRHCGRRGEPVRERGRGGRAGRPQRRRQDDARRAALGRAAPRRAARSA